MFAQCVDPTCWPKQRDGDADTSNVVGPSRNVLHLATVHCKPTETPLTLVSVALLVGHNLKLWNSLLEFSPNCRGDFPKLLLQVAVLVRSAFNQLRPFLEQRVLASVMHTLVISRLDF